MRFYTNVNNDVLSLAYVVVNNVVYIIFCDYLCKANNVKQL